MYELFYVSLFENLMSEKMQIVHENDFKLKLFQNGFIQNAHATEKCIGYKSCKSYLRRNLTDSQ